MAEQLECNLSEIKKLEYSSREKSERVKKKEEEIQNLHKELQESNNERKVWIEELVMLVKGLQAESEISKETKP